MRIAKRGLVIALLSCLLCVALVGCGQSPEGVPDTPAGEDADAALVTNQEVATLLQGGLHERWSLSNPVETNEEYQEAMVRLIDVELAALAPLEGASFEDEVVGQQVNDYLTVLRAQRAEMGDYASHPALREYNYAVLGENGRRPLLEALVDELGISFEDDDQFYYDMTVAEMPWYAGAEPVEDLISVTECRNYEEYPGGCSCEVKVTNNTVADYRFVYVTMRFYDADGTELWEDTRIQEGVEAGSSFWQVFSRDSGDKPATVRFCAYEVCQGDSEGEYVFSSGEAEPVVSTEFVVG